MIADLIEAATVTATLADGSDPVGDAVQVGRWERDGERLTATVSFGPYASRVAFDSVLVSANGGAPESLRASDDARPISLPAGFEFEYEITLSASSAQVG